MSRPGAEIHEAPSEFSRLTGISRTLNSIKVRWSLLHLQRPKSKSCVPLQLSSDDHVPAPDQIPASRGESVSSNSSSISSYLLQAVGYQLDLAQQSYDDGNYFVKEDSPPNQKLTTPNPAPSPLENLPPLRINTSPHVPRPEYTAERLDNQLSRPWQVDSTPPSLAEQFPRAQRRSRIGQRFHPYPLPPPLPSEPKPSFLLPPLSDAFDSSFNPNPHPEGGRFFSLEQDRLLVSLIMEGGLSWTQIADQVSQQGGHLQSGAEMEDRWQSILLPRWKSQRLVQTPEPSTCTYGTIPATPPYHSQVLISGVYPPLFAPITSSPSPFPATRWRPSASFEPVAGDLSSPPTSSFMEPLSSSSALMSPEHRERLEYR